MNETLNPYFLRARWISHGIQKYLMKKFNTKRDIHVKNNVNNIPLIPPHKSPKASTRKWYKCQDETSTSNWTLILETFMLNEN